MVLYPELEGLDFSWGWKDSGHKFQCFGFWLLLGDDLFVFFYCEVWIYCHKNSNVYI